jgi:methionine-rich copper-binding protein CopC
VLVLLTVLVLGPATSTVASESTAAPSTAETELAVVDTTVEDHEVLARAARETGMDVVNVSSAKELTAALSERSNLAAVHVLSHGTVGTVQIGDDTLQRGTLDQYSGLTGALDSSLGADGDVLLYGCRVAENGSGQAFVGDVANVTGGDVAASEDLTGAADRGGDWDLEVTRGGVETRTLGGAAVADFSNTLDLLNKAEAVSFTTEPVNAGADTYLLDATSLPDDTVVTVEEEFDGPSKGFYLDQYDASGSALSRTDISSLISPRTSSTINTDIKLLALDNGNLAMIWETTSSGKAIDDPYFRIVKPDGTSVTSATRINQNTADLDRFTEAAQLSNGNIAFVWANGGSDYQLRIFDTSANPVIDQKSVTDLGSGNSGSSQYRHRIAANDAGSFMITYDYVNEDQYKGIIFNNDGTAKTVGGVEHFDISSISKGGSASKSITTLSNDNFLVTFQAEPSDTASRETRVAVFDPSGNKDVGDISVVTVGNNPTYPSYALPNGGFVVGNTTSDTELNGFRYDNSGNPLESSSILTDPSEFRIRGVEAANRGLATVTDVSTTPQKVRIWLYDWPVANNDPTFDGGDATTLTVDEDASTTSIDSLLTASDADDDSLTWEVNSGPSHGSLSGFPASESGTTSSGVDPSGLTYEPNADFDGSDSFEVKVKDGNGGTDIATVNVDVQDAPEVTSITRASPTSQDTNADSVDFDVTFSTEVDGIDTTDFTLDTTGSASGTIQSFGPTTASNTVTVTVDSINGDGDLRLDVSDDDSIEDTTNNVALGGDGTGGSADGSYTSGETYTIDNTDPGFGTSNTASKDEGTTGNVLDVDAGDDGTPGSEVSDYSLASAAGSDASAFSIDNNGQISLDSALDFESPTDDDTNNDYELDVTATDAAGNTKTQTVTVNINDIDEAPTAPDDSSESTDEDSTVSVSDGASADLLELASDPDTSDTISLDKIDGNSFSDGSQVTVGSSATVTVNSDGSWSYDPNGQFENLDPGDSTTDSYTYTVTDNDGDTDKGTITLTINGQNDAPTGVSLSSTDVGQSGGTDAVVGSFSSTDTDSDDSHTYSLVSGSGDGDNDQFNINSGDLRADDASSMAAGNYDVRVETTDSNGATFEDTFTISVTDDVAPTLSSSTPADGSTGHNPVDDLTLTFSEDIQFNTGNIVLNDIDGSTTEETFDVTSDTGGGDGTVSISGNTLTINPTSNLGSSTEYAVQIDSSAIDDTASTPNDYAGISNNDALDFTTANTDPSFTSGSSVSVTVDEDGSVDLTSALEVNDISSADTLIWSVVSAPSNGATSGIDGQTRNIDGSNSPFTLDTSPTYTPDSDVNGADSFDVRISDTNPGTTTDTITVSVTIDAVNDAPSITLGGDQSVGADTSQQTVSNFATGFDPGPIESGQSISDFLVTESSDPNDVLTSVDIANNGDLTYTPADNVAGTATVDVQVKDDGGTSNGGTDTSPTKQFDISVDNQDPTFSAGTTNAAAVTEGTTGQVLDVDADDDTGSNFDVDVMYSLGSAVGDDTAFSIDSSTGQLSVDSPQDFESPGDSDGNGDYELTVTATDTDGNSDQQTLTVSLDDVEETPSFTSGTSASVAETATDGTTVLDVDANVGGTTDTGVGYAIASGNGDSAYAIDASGLITVGDASELDYERSTSRTLTVEASEGTQSGTQDITISVTDSDESPTFSSGTSDSIAEDASNGDPVHDVNADVGGASDEAVSYTITGGNSAGAFAIDSNTGQIAVADDSQFNFEGTNSFSLTVEASEGAATNSRTVSISVTDVNDAPTDIGLSSAAVAQSGGTDAVVGTLSITDEDDTTATYNLVSGAGDANNSAFAIASSDLVATDAAGLAEGDYDVRVEADDGSGGTVEKAFTVAVTDDVSPTLIASTPADDVTGVDDDTTVTITFGESVAFGSGVLTLREADSGGNFTDAETFDVGSDTGSSDGDVSVSEATVTVNPTGDLSRGTTYAVRIDAGALVDTAATPNEFGGIADDTTLNFTVEAPRSRGGGGGGGGDDSPPEPTEPTVVVDSTAESERDRSNVTVSDAEAGTPVTISFEAEDTTGGTDPGETQDGSARNVSLSQLAISTTTGGDFTLNVTTEETRSMAGTGAETETNGNSQYQNELAGLDGDERAFALATGARSVGTVIVDHSVPDEDIEDVTFTFRVRKTYLDSVDVTADSVALYRDESTRWNRLSTTVVAETETAYVFSATSPGLSTFRMGSPVPLFEVTDARVSQSSIEPGGAVDVTVTIANRGGANGTYDAVLLANGETITTNAVEIPAGGERTVTLTNAFTTNGDYALAIENTSAGTVSVVTPQLTESPTDSLTESPTESPTGTPTDESDGFPLSAILLLLAIAVVAGGALVWSRRQDWE